jgi:hypothetical protein
MPLFCSFLPLRLGTIRNVFCIEPSDEEASEWIEIQASSLELSTRSNGRRIQSRVCSIPLS